MINKAKRRRWGVEFSLDRHRLATLLNPDPESWFHSWSLVSAVHPFWIHLYTPHYLLRFGPIASGLPISVSLNKTQTSAEMGKQILKYMIEYDDVYLLKQETMDRRPTELQLNNAKLCNTKNSHIKVIVNGTITMLSSTYTHLNVNIVRETQPVNIICLEVMRKTRLYTVFRKKHPLLFSCITLRTRT